MLRSVLPAASTVGAWTARSAALALAVVLGTGCGGDDGEGPAVREDAAYELSISLEGSLQNPAFSPDGTAIVFTRFRGGYNVGPADLYVYELASGTLRESVADGSDNVNLPGSAWSPATGQIVFSSSREPHDEIYVIDAAGGPGDEVRVTGRADHVAYEPSLSPDGLAVVFESHAVDVEDNGVIMVVRLDGTGGYRALTAAGDDCRQPNWSPAGDTIVYQRRTGSAWELWRVAPDGSDPARIAAGAGDQTDASFDGAGAWIVFSGNGGVLDLANVFAVPLGGGTPVQLTRSSGYDGAPSVSPGGDRLAFEACAGDPDGSAGTRLWLLELPAWPPGQ
ncbi:MAG: PD40 domain-containing protein [Deltaproteobacteria bacterium]|nr:PD40 domain-containing protein [Deltaproteobacteria bacterium]